MGSNPHTPRKSVSGLEKAPTEQSEVFIELENELTRPRKGRDEYSGGTRLNKLYSRSVNGYRSVPHHCKHVKALLSVCL